VVDWGVWSRPERDACRDEARAYGARVALCFRDVPFEELWNRLSRRNAELPAGTFHIARADLLRWSKLFEPPSAEEMALYDLPDNPAIATLL
jgi:predicted kinase